MTARDVFLRAEIQRVTGNLTAALDGYIVASETSPDFDLAYTMAVLQARRLAQAGQRSRATEVLQRLIKTNPSRSEGKALLSRIQE